MQNNYNFNLKIQKTGGAIYRQGLHFSKPESLLDMSVIHTECASSASRSAQTFQLLFCCAFSRVHERR